MQQRLKSLQEHIVIELPKLSYLLQSDMMKQSAEYNNSPPTRGNRPGILKLEEHLHNITNGSYNHYFHTYNIIRNINITSICCKEMNVEGSGDNNVLNHLSKITPLSIEIVDDTNSVNDINCKSFRMSGLLNYKMRLLKKSGWSVIVLNSKDIERCPDLNALLIDSIMQMNNEKKRASVD